jgi:hypothetical protein
MLTLAALNSESCKTNSARCFDNNALDKKGYP